MAKVQGRERTKKYLRSARGIKVGDQFRYISNGFEVSDGDTVRVISKGAEYDVTVIQVTEHLITLRMWVDQSTTHRPCIWDSLPYNWSIRKVDVGRTERLYLYD